MKKYLFLLLGLFFVSCDEEVSPPVNLDGNVTAKENITAVVNEARAGFSPDAELAGIYGRNVSIKGEVDLLNTNSLNAFVYIIQSDAIGDNEFYVPVYGAGPIKSPIDFNTMLSFVKDTTAKNTVGTALGFLATVSISANATYQDSPETLDTLNSRADVIQFRNDHPDTKIDMFLFPGKAIDPDNGLVNSADWVVNYYSETASLVLWLNSTTKEVTVLSN